MSRNVVLSGNLDFLSLAELLQLLGSNGSTGVLRLSSSFSNAPGVIHMVNGNPVNASHASLGGLEALYGLFGWSEATFEFSLEKVEVPRLINRNPMELILDGLRMLDDGEIAKLGPVSYPAGSRGPRRAAGDIALIKRPLIHYVNVADEEAFPRGAPIVEEGKFGSWLWVVLRGVAEMVKETPKGPIPLFRIGEGACVGNFSSVVKKGFRRLATVKAVSERVQLGVLDPQPFHAEFANLSRELRALLISLDNRLRGLLESIAAIHAGGDPLRPPKEWRVALEQGSGDARVFQIHRGQALVFRRTAEGEVPLASLAEEDLFGQFPFLNLGHEPQSAVVYAPAGLQVRPLDTEALQREYDQLSAALRNILDFSASCISVSTAVACAAFRKAHPAEGGPAQQEKGG